jgi:transmembrane sensor
MNAAPQDTDIPSVEEQAGAWCARLSTGVLPPHLQAAFDRWIAEDPANAAAFGRALAVWRGLHEIGSSPEMIRQRTAALEALRQANRHRWSRGLSGRPKAWLAAAASLLLVLLSIAWLARPQPQEIATGLAERRALVLADGSRVSLDSETNLSVNMEREQRALRLVSGRAKFDVASDPTRPFTVAAGKLTIIATGTSFSVELVGAEVRVIVYEGRVAVLRGPAPAPERLLQLKNHPTAATTNVTPGKEMIGDSAATVAPRVAALDIARSLAWEDGQLNFADEPLATAAERLNRYNSEKIVIGDPQTAAIRVNGVFNAGDSGAFVEAVSKVYSLRVSREDGKITLAAKEPR